MHHDYVPMSHWVPRNACRRLRRKWSRRLHRSVTPGHLCEAEWPGDRRPDGNRPWKGRPKTDVMTVDDPSRVDDGQRAPLLFILLPFYFFTFRPIIFTLLLLPFYFFTFLPFPPLPFVVQLSFLSLLAISTQKYNNFHVIIWKIDKYTLILPLVSKCLSACKDGKRITKKACILE